MHNTENKQFDKYILNTLETKECSLENDLLQISEQLENIKKILYDNSKSVIAVTAPYGGGKTFFARCLQKELDQSGTFTSRYIDLWENDYKDPVITVTSELLKSIKDEEEQSKFLITTSNCIKSLLKNTSFGGSGFGFKVDIPLEDVKDMLLGKEKDEIKKLKEEIKKVTEKKKLVFLVDEIDRCRPEFAVEFLERIKHFFDIDNIIFVLFVNDSYLSDLTCAYTSNYGTYSSFISKYINKIVTLNFANYEYFTHHIYEQIIKNFDLQHHKRYFVYYKHIHKIIKHFNLSLRDIKQILFNDYAQFIFRFESTGYAFLSADFLTGNLIFLIYVIKAKKINEFNNIKKGNKSYLKNLISELKQAELDEDYIKDIQNYAEFDDNQSADIKETVNAFNLLL